MPLERRSGSQEWTGDLEIRCRPRFFEQVRHKTIYLYSGNKPFFTKSCHHQNYQNYEQPSQTSQNFKLFFQF